MRPLAGFIVDSNEKEKLKKQLKEHWIVIHIETDVEHNAEYFAENPEARSKRSGLEGLSGYREIYLR
jgi:hypothetical protein